MLTLVGFNNTLSHSLSLETQALSSSEIAVIERWKDGKMEEWRDRNNSWWYRTARVCSWSWCLLTFCASQRAKFLQSHVKITGVQPRPLTAQKLAMGWHKPGKRSPSCRSKACQYSALWLKLFLPLFAVGPFNLKLEDKIVNWSGGTYLHLSQRDDCSIFYSCLINLLDHRYDNHRGCGGNDDRQCSVQQSNNHVRSHPGDPVGLLKRISRIMALALEKSCR